VVVVVIVVVVVEPDRPWGIRFDDDDNEYETEGRRTC